MKSIFSKQPDDMLKKIALLLTAATLSMGLSFGAQAKSPKAQKSSDTTATTSHPDLDLSAPDEWLDPDDMDTDPFEQAGTQKQEEPLIISKHKKRPVNVDCGMDVNPYAQPDSSIGNRLTGECDFNYRY